MSKTNLYETELLQLIFQNIAMAGVGDAVGIRNSSAAGSLYFSLHSADPGETGNPSTNEVAFTGYARVAMPRSSSAFGVSGGTAFNATGVLFPNCTGGQATATHFGLGKEASLATGLIYKGAFDTPLAISNNIQASIASGAASFTED